MDDDRTTELEIKVAFLERTLGELDGVVRRLSEEMELLKREVARLRGLAEPNTQPPSERPPHY